MQLSNGDKVLLTVVSMVALSVLGVVAICSHYNNQFALAAVREGYTQTPLPGMQGAYWVKATK